MKRLRKARFIRAVAKGLCGLLLVPQLWTWTARLAVAQTATHLTVVVVDFNNLSGVDGPLLGRRAAAAMSLQLRQSENWDTVNQSNVDRAIADLHLHPPFDRADLQTLAHTLDAQAVLFGDITAAGVSSNPAQATVRLVVKLMDVGSGELINGAVVTGTASHIGLASAQDVLLDEALSKAAFEARQDMERYQLPQGTIQNTSVTGAGASGATASGNEDALLNIGAREGVRPGMQFVVLRGRDLVGYLSATTVEADKTTARVTQNFRGVKPEDTVRAIYTLPEGAEPAVAQPQTGQVVSPNVTPPHHGSHKSLTGALRMFAGVALLLGVVALAGRTSGATSAFDVNAQAAQVSAATPAASPAVRVTWARPHQVPPNAIVQYQVYRVDPTIGAPILVGIAYESDREWFDTTLPTMVNNYFSGTGGDAGSPTTTAAPVPGITPGFQYRYYIQTVYNEGVSLNTTSNTTTNGTTTGVTTGTTTTGTTTTGTTTTGTTTTGTTTTGTTTTATTTTGATTAGTTTAGTTTGTTTTGATTGAPTTGGGATMNTGTGLLISRPSSLSGFATPLLPPTISSPADNSTVDLTSVTFTWTTVQGADTYSVQVSADPTNPNSYQQVASAIIPSKTAGQTLSRTVNISNQFAGRTLLAWRVGAKNSQDRTPPVGGYVFSNVASFTPQQAATAAASRGKGKH